MPDIEKMLAEWRQRMAAKLPEAAVRELEEHLRDHLEACTSRGMDRTAAFAEGVKLIGEPEAIAPAFRRAEVSRSLTIWRKGVTLAFLVGSGLMVFPLVGIWMTKADPLLALHVFTIATGYLALLAAGFLGVGGLVVLKHRTLTEAERGDVRRWSLRLTVLGGILQPVGTVLGMFWAADNMGRAWGWDPKETGAVVIMTATWMLVLAQTRRNLGDGARGTIALLGLMVGLFGWFGASAVASPFPVALLGATLVASQAAVAWVRPGKRIAE